MGYICEFHGMIRRTIWLEPEELAWCKTECARFAAKGERVEIRENVNGKIAIFATGSFFAWRPEKDDQSRIIYSHSVKAGGE